MKSISFGVCALHMSRCHSYVTSVSTSSGPPTATLKLQLFAFDCFVLHNISIDPTKQSP